LLPQATINIEVKKRVKYFFKIVFYKL